MATLTQLLILTVVLSAIYASYVHNPAFYKKMLSILPDFGQVPSDGGHGVPGGHDAHHDPHAAHDAHASHGAPAVSDIALSSHVKVVVYVPDAHADEVRQAIGQAGGGQIGNYTFCSFSSLGTGRYLPGNGANPMIGTVGVHERVEEERIEFTCSRPNLQKVVSTIKKVHPYEEIIIDIYPLEAHPEPEPVTAH